MELMTIEYKPKDMLFNNGIVNLYRFLEERDLDIKMEFNSSSLVLSMDEKESEEIYSQILGVFFKQYKIVHQTKK